MKQIGTIGTESRQGYRVYTSDDCGCAVVATPKGLSGHGGVVSGKDKSLRAKESEE